MREEHYVMWPAAVMEQLICVCDVCVCMRVCLSVCVAVCVNTGKHLLFLLPIAMATDF